MALYFTENQIDEFKECFFFHARKGHISTEADLSIIIRSLNFSVTKDEVGKYFTQAIAGDGKIDFASFLNIMHEHSQVERRQSELKAALVAQDRNKRGTVDATQLRHILTNMGEKLSAREVDALFREAGVQPSGQININGFVDAIMTPSPDY
ncbi:calmodulin-like protein 4 [Aplysia californica]|uniref:Calmodulin-like protein 4 n=1 Tax=Aplysia californica TaxID=6500 RepID=A0ABM1A216_APLCA|nr:calmodulin-like protein 4 [Aplysia californica]